MGVGLLLQEGKVAEPGLTNLMFGFVWWGRNLSRLDMSSLVSKAAMWALRTWSLTRSGCGLWYTQPLTGHRNTVSSFTCTPCQCRRRFLDVNVVAHDPTGAADSSLFLNFSPTPLIFLGTCQLQLGMLSSPAMNSSKSAPPLMEWYKMFIFDRWQWRREKWGMKYEVSLMCRYWRCWAVYENVELWGGWVVPCQLWKCLGWLNAIERCLYGKPGPNWVILHFTALRCTNLTISRTTEPMSRREREGKKNTKGKKEKKKVTPQIKF